MLRVCVRSDLEQQSRLNLTARLTAKQLYDGGPRDRRWSNRRARQLEAGWDNSRPIWGNYIPEYGSASRIHGSVGQVEEFIKRPITVGNWRARDSLRKARNTIFVNSFTWNRRHYEPSATNTRIPYEDLPGWGPAPGNSQCSPGAEQQLECSFDPVEREAIY